MKAMSLYQKFDNWVTWVQMICTNQQCCDSPKKKFRSYNNETLTFSLSLISPFQ